MSDNALHTGGDFFAQMAARQPYSRRMRRLFERGVIAAVAEGLATVNVGRRDDGTDILLEEVPIVAGYNPTVGDWVALRYEGGHGGAPLVFGPGVSDETEAEPSTSSAEVIAARDSVRHGSFGSLDARLEAHEQESADPHGAALTQTVKVVAPLLESPAEADLVVRPPAGRQVLFGDPSGTARPVVVADAANSTRATGELLKVAAAPTLAGSMVLAGLCLKPVNTDTGRLARGLGVSLEFTGANRANANSEALQAGLVLEGSAVFPNPGAGHPTSVIDANLTLGAGFSGSAPKVVGLLLHPIVNAAAGGAATAVNLVEAYDGIAAAGVIGTLTAIKLPDLSANVGTYRHMDLGAGTIYAGGNVVWEAGGAAVVPLAIRGAASQSGDLWQLQDSSANVLARFDSQGRLGVGCSPTQLVELAAVTSNPSFQATRYGDSHPGDIRFRNARGTPETPTATQSGDGLMYIFGGGHDGTAFSSPTLIAAYATENFGAGARGSKLTFGVTPNGSTARVLKMILDQSGYLMIGSGNTPHSTMQSAGSLAAAVKVITTSDWSYTATANEQFMLCQAGGIARNLNLPAASGCAGRWYVIIYDSGTANVTIDPGGLGLTLNSSNPRYIVFSDGSNWRRGT